MKRASPSCLTEEHASETAPAAVRAINATPSRGFHSSKPEAMPSTRAWTPASCQMSSAAAAGSFTMTQEVANSL